jgi:pre-mRNA 3'-end-processing factor FIP1
MYIHPMLQSDRLSRPPPRATSVKPQQAAAHDRKNSIDPSPPSKAVKIEHPTATPSANTNTARGAPTHAGKEGKDYPQIRTSTVNLAANPNWPGVNKPITQLDIDADLAENSKLWRLPGTDQTDFFNYGFDEYTWTQYCVRQQSMAGTIAQQRDEDMQMKAMLGMGGAGGGGGGGGGMPGMPGPAPPGMPDMDQMMQMMSQGMDPSKMDMGQFMAMMGGMPGGGTPQPGGFGGQNGFGGQSPHPQGQFQPPSGPGGGQGFGQNMNMEGLSPQQIAIMQQEQNAMGGQGGGGGRGRGGRRGRGGYY